MSYMLNKPYYTTANNPQVQYEHSEMIKVPQQELRALELPELQLPELELPELEVPELELPELEVPELELPELELPELELLELEVPELERGPELFKAEVPSVLPRPIDRNIEIATVSLKRSKIYKSRIAVGAPWLRSYEDLVFENNPNEYQVAERQGIKYLFKPKRDGFFLINARTAKRKEDEEVETVRIPQLELGENATMEEMSSTPARASGEKESQIQESANLINAQKEEGREGEQEKRERDEKVKPLRLSKSNPQTLNPPSSGYEMMEGMSSIPVNYASKEKEPLNQKSVNLINTRKEKGEEEMGSIPVQASGEKECLIQESTFTHDVEGPRASKRSRKTAICKLCTHK